MEHKVQMSMFRLLSAILHLGNVIIDEGELDSTFINQSDRSFSIFCSLLKIDEHRMRTWLCNKRIKTGVEVVTMTLNLSQVLFFISILHLIDIIGLLNRVSSMTIDFYRQHSLEMLSQNTSMLNYLDGLSTK